MLDFGALRKLVRCPVAEGTSVVADMVFSETARSYTRTTDPDGWRTEIRSIGGTVMTNHGQIFGPSFMKIVSFDEDSASDLL